MASAPPARIQTIVFTGQAQTFTLLDDAGRPLMPFLSWMDKRATAESRELAERLGKDFHHHCGFPAPIPQLQLSKLLWIKHNRPDWLRNAARVAALQGFLARRLAGTDAIDNNQAAMSGMYSLAWDDWWPAALEMCGLARARMGCLVPTGTAVPAQLECADIELAPDIKVVFAGNDQTAGAYAAVDGREDVVLTLGTALAVYLYAGALPGPYHKSSCWGPFPGGGYYELATRDEGCAALDWAVDRVMPGKRSGFLACAESAAPGSALFYPDRIRSSAAWVGASDPAARARAVLEGVCFSARELMEDDLRIAKDGLPLIVTGGGAVNPFWLKMFADVCNCPVRRSSNDVLLGAAMIARKCAAPSILKTDMPIMPTPSLVDSYAGIYQVWRDNHAGLLKR